MSRRYGRIGKFYVTFDVEANPFSYKSLFEGLIILRAEPMFERNSIEYFAAGEMFDEISPAMMTPVYEPTFDAKSNEVIWRRCD